jgi:predicted peroxiredoxin/TusA-related sulfurtransferase
MNTLIADRTIDHRGRTITTFVIYDASITLQAMEKGELLEIVTDDFAPFRADIAAWCAATGSRLIETKPTQGDLSFLVEKGPAVVKDSKLAMVISDDGLEELLSPLGFALGAALEGIEVSLYFQGPAVRVLAKGFKTRLKGWARPFSRFAATGLAKAGHIAPQEKLRQLHTLGAEIYACGGSLDHFKVKAEDFIFDDIPVVEYLTFMAVMEDANVQLYI